MREAKRRNNPKNSHSVPRHGIARTLLFSLVSSHHSCRTNVHNMTKLILSLKMQEKLHFSRILHDLVSRQNRRLLAAAIASHMNELCKRKLIVSFCITPAYANLSKVGYGKSRFFQKNRLFPYPL